MDPASEFTVAAAARPEHSLDRPVWSALTTRHRHFALGDGTAWRYPGAVAPFTATTDLSTASFKALERLVEPEETVAMVLVDPVTVPGPWEIVMVRSLDQMVGSLVPAPEGSADLVALGLADVPDMVELTGLTRPGPFGPRTFEMGTYLGVREAGRLVAMAGERMAADGFTEISAVCTHPGHRGRGHARALVTVLAQAIQARGETAFLHVLSENASAIALYRQLGFSRRSGMTFTVFRRPRS